MRKKILMFIILPIFCLGLLGFARIFDTASAASINEEIVYEIKNANQNNISIESQSIGISRIESSWSKVLSIIYDNSNSSDKIILEFNNFNLNLTNESTLEFNNNFNFYLTGNISSNLTSPIITLSSNSNSNIEFENLSFNSPNSNFIIYSNNSCNSLIFGNNITYSNSNFDLAPYLINYNRNNSLVAKDNLNYKLKIFIPYYDLSNEQIIDCSLNSSNNIEIFYPDSGSYDITLNYNSYQNALIANSSINFSFNTNGGAYKTLNASNYKIDNETGNYVINYPYKLEIISSISFNNQGELTKPYGSFNGWFGEISINGTKYFFDTNMLAMFVSSSNDINQITKFFTTDISKLDNNYAVLDYSNSNINSYEYFGHLKFFLDNGLKPTYVAKWTNAKFTITFETNTETIIEPITAEYEQSLPEFEIPSKNGYSFGGWYTNSDLTTPLNFDKMPAYNLKLYAKWNINSYKIHFNCNGGSPISDISYEYNSKTEKPSAPEKQGYNFAGWYSDSNLLNEFNFDLMPANDITIYAKWEIKHFTLYIIPSNGTSGLSMSNLEYNSLVPTLPPLNQTGFEFVGWYSDKGLQNEFDFNTKITSDLNIYAKLEPILYTINFVTYTNSNIENISGYYNSNLSLPANPSRTGYSFAGWYTDEGLQNEFTLNIIPAENLTLYAKWIQKQTLEFELNVQSCTYGENGVYYKNETGVSGLTIYYMVNGEWTKDIPTELGTYDIRVTRNEDEVFTSVDKILEGGFKIVRPVKNLNWLIVFFYFATIAEIAVSVLVRIMRKKKMSASLVLIGTTLIADSQFAHLVISGIMCLAGFVYMIYQLVELSRTINNENFAPSKEDNRERFKSELIFQNDKKNSDLEFETKTKTNESFGDKYSNEDILAMLESDDYDAKIKSSRKYESDDNENIEDDKNYGNYNNTNQDLNENEDFENEDNELYEEDNIMPQTHYDILKNKDSNEENNDKNDNEE